MSEALKRQQGVWEEREGGGEREREKREREERERGEEREGGEGGNREGEGTIMFTEYYELAAQAMQSHLTGCITETC